MSDDEQYVTVSVCGDCENTIEDEWKYCPYCGCYINRDEDELEDEIELDTISSNDDYIRNQDRENDEACPYDDEDIEECENWFMGICMNCNLYGCLHDYNIREQQKSE